MHGDIREIWQSRTSHEKYSLENIRLRAPTLIFSRSDEVLRVCDIHAVLQYSSKVVLQVVFVLNSALLTAHVVYSSVATDDDGKAVLVEVYCETDFVAKDGSFLEFTSSVAKAALGLEEDTVDGLLTAELKGSTVEDTRQALVSKIGENIQVRRLVARGGKGTTVGAYVHMNCIGVLVELEGGSSELAADVAMHVAAMNPPYAVPEDVSPDVLEKERAFLSEQALDSGKPKEIVEKMIEGRIRKYLE